MPPQKRRAHRPKLKLDRHFRSTLRAFNIDPADFDATTLEFMQPRFRLAGFDTPAQDIKHMQPRFLTDEVSIPWTRLTFLRFLQPGKRQQN